MKILGLVPLANITGADEVLHDDAHVGGVKVTAQAM
jgi:hypothetical protein